MTTAISSFRNWSAICAIENALLRLLVSVTDDEEVLAGLQRGFPHLFSDTPSKTPLIPASVLSHEARIYSEKDEYYPKQINWDEKLNWNSVTEKFGIPLAFEFGFGEVPKSLARQLVGQKLQPGIKVTHQGVECIVTSLPDTDDLSLGDEIPVWYVDQEDFFLYGVPARFIDLSS